MATRKLTLSEQLSLLAEHAPGLRRAGVRSFTIGDLTVELAAPELESTRAMTGDPVAVDPLSDPDTYGSMGRVPGFQRDDLTFE